MNMMTTCQKTKRRWGQVLCCQIYIYIYTQTHKKNLLCECMPVRRIHRVEVKFCTIISKSVIALLILLTRDCLGVGALRHPCAEKPRAWRGIHRRYVEVRCCAGDYYLQWNPVRWDATQFSGSRMSRIMILVKPFLTHMTKQAQVLVDPLWRNSKGKY